MARIYRYAPRPTSGPMSFTLEGSGLTVDSGRKLSIVQLGAVESVRLTYEPRSFAQRAFRATLRLKDGKTVSLASLSWRSLVEAERLDGEYGAFLRALIAAVAAANPQARFVAGRPRWLWWATVALAALSLLAIVLVVARAVQNGAVGLALLGGVLVAAGIWQLEPMVRLNRPRRFSPEAPPPDLVP